MATMEPTKNPRPTGQKVSEMDYTGSVSNKDLKRFKARSTSTRGQANRKTGRGSGGR
jgi:hypothetical protein